MKTFRLLFIFTAALMLSVSCDKLETDPNGGDDLRKGKTTLPAEFLEEWPDLGGCEQYYSLIGGQTIDMGMVVVGNDDSYVYVMYSAGEGNLIAETHLYLGPIDEMPETSKSNPKIGWFPYATEETSDKIIYKIDVTQVPTDENGCFDVAAHAVVVCEDGGCEETAWASGGSDDLYFVLKSRMDGDGGEVETWAATENNNAGYIFNLSNSIGQVFDMHDIFWTYTPGELAVTLESGIIKFTVNSDYGSLIWSRMFLGTLDELNAIGQWNYYNFPYQINVVDDVHVFEFSSSLLNSGDEMEFDGNRWGFYVNYCLCE
jgi:hypothetical protein